VEFIADRHEPPVFVLRSDDGASFAVLSFERSGFELLSDELLLKSTANRRELRSVNGGAEVTVLIFLATAAWASVVPTSLTSFALHGPGHRKMTDLALSCC
jgi:hypothetical protein